MVQWLGLHTFTAEGVGSIFGQETRFYKPCSVAKKKKKKKESNADLNFCIFCNYVIVWSLYNVYTQLPFKINLFYLKYFAFHLFDRNIQEYAN